VRSISRAAIVGSQTVFASRAEFVLADSGARCQPLLRRRVPDDKDARRNAFNKLPKGDDMATVTVDFDAPHIARRIEELSQSELDRLPFGVILIDRQGTVLFYSETEARQSGYGKRPLGLNLFELSPCLGSDDFKGRITRAMEEGPVDLEFGWQGDFADPRRDVRFRVQSASGGGVWIMVERDIAASPSV
jgi:photoactive yellow protein